MLALPLILAVLLWHLTNCFNWKKNVFDLIQKLPGIKWYPFFGTSYAYWNTTKEDVLDKFLSTIEKCEPFARSWNGNKPEIHLTKPDHIKVILKSSAHTTKGAFYQYLFPWLGEGLFISEGAKWFMQRKLVTPTFHFKILENFMKVFAEKANDLSEKLDDKSDGEYFDIVPEIMKCTLEIICETAMGVPLDAVTDDAEKYIENVHCLTELAMWRYWRPYIKDPLFYILPQGRKYKKTLRELNTFSKNVIAYKKQQFNARKNQSKGKDQQPVSFLDQILNATDNTNFMSDADLQSLVNTFILAGFETTASTICWALFLLGSHPAEQEKVYEEVQNVLRDKKSLGAISDISELKYLECVIKESLRMYPVLAFITRNLNEEVQIENYKIPAGTQAVLHIMQVHRDSEHFPEPSKFNPDRFLPENTKGRHPFAYIPFSAGPRNCIGMKFALIELKYMLAIIVNKFKITSLDHPDKLKIYAHVLVRSQSGIKVKLERRC